METLQQLFSFILHIDTHLLAFVAAYGTLTYFALFAVIFCETAFIVTPFLPGDSLLFAAGGIAAGVDGALNLQLLLMTLIIAAVLGNKVNYLIGRAIGPKIFSAKDSFLLNKKHLLEAHAFYEKHGGKTIIMARFIPIIRTFVPFVAGIGAMSLSRFSFYNILSGMLWVGSLLGAGYYLGSQPFVQQHFSIIVYGIVAISFAPTVIVFISRMRKATG
jgi:membrane-associated protein